MTKKNGRQHKYFRQNKDTRQFPIFQYTQVYIFGIFSNNLARITFSWYYFPPEVINLEKG